MKRFLDRRDAGERLAKELRSYRGKNPVVIGLPHGGVVVAFSVWERLGGDFDVFALKKLRAPNQPELGIGAIGQEGALYLNRTLIGQIGISEKYLSEEIASRKEELQEESMYYRERFPPVPLKDRVGILVDDGLATGATMMAAIQVVATRGPRSIIVAVPIGAPESVERIRIESQVSKVYCLEAPDDFSAVGQFYKNFQQVTDEEVLHCLQKARKKEDRP